jgi:hypothetical protein
MLSCVLFILPVSHIVLLSICHLALFVLLRTHHKQYNYLSIDIANNATSVPGATTLADGAPTTFHSFLEELGACTVDECNVYFNMHTNYSFNLNAGAYGLARAQLSPVTCDEKDLKPGFYMISAKCFLASATSDNTNMVTGIPNQLAPTAGSTIGDILVVYQNGGGAIKNSDDDASSSASLSLLLSLSIATITMSTMML